MKQITQRQLESIKVDEKKLAFEIHKLCFGTKSGKHLKGKHPLYGYNYCVCCGRRLSI